MRFWKKEWNNGSSAASACALFYRSMQCHRLSKSINLQEKSFKTKRYAAQISNSSNVAFILTEQRKSTTCIQINNQFILYPNSSKQLYKLINGLQTNREINLVHTFKFTMTIFKTNQPFWTFSLVPRWSVRLSKLIDTTDSILFWILIFKNF